jgi:hypothetical protein
MSNNQVFYCGNDLEDPRPATKELIKKICEEEY